MTAAGLRPVPAPPESVTMTVTAPLRHLCPFVEEVDNGQVTITWSTAGKTLELHALAGYLQGFAAMEVSHEALTDELRHDLEGVPGIYAVDVTTTWETAGMGVKCSTLPTLARMTP